MNYRRWVLGLKEKRNDLAYVILAILISGGVMATIQFTWVYREQRVISEVLDIPLADLHIDIFPPCVSINQTIISAIQSIIDDSELFPRWRWSIQVPSEFGDINSSLQSINTEADWVTGILDKILEYKSSNFSLEGLEKRETVIPLSIAEEAGLFVGDVFQVILDDLFDIFHNTTFNCDFKGSFKTVNLTIKAIYHTETLYENVLSERGVNFPLFINHDFVREILNTSQTCYNRIDVLLSNEINSIAFYQSVIDSYSWILHNELLDYAGNVSVVSYPHTYSVSLPDSPLPHIQIISPRQILMAILTDSAFQEPRISFWNRI